MSIGAPEHCQVCYLNKRVHHQIQNDDDWYTVHFPPSFCFPYYLRKMMNHELHETHVINHLTVTYNPTSSMEEVRNWSLFANVVHHDYWKSPYQWQVIFLHVAQRPHNRVHPC